MSKDVATRLMPNFRNPEFLDVLSRLEGSHMDLSNAYLTSLAAMSLGMKCAFVRSFEGVDLEGNPVNFTNPLPTIYRVTSGKKSDSFHGSISLMKVKRESARIGKNKAITRRVLASAGIRTPFGGLAWSDNMRALDSIADAGVTRVLVKPNAGSFGRGIRANVTIDDARAHIQAHPGEEFVVEQYLVGREFRIHVVGGEYSGCDAKIHDHVIGNGRQTLKALVAAKHQAQLSNPLTRAKANQAVSKEKFLLRAGVNLQSVPRRGEYIRLNDNELPKFHNGVYQTAEVGDDVKTLARNVAQCMNADTIAIDVINRGSDGIYVLEVNSKPNIMVGCFPMNAEWNLRLPEAILRNSFPLHKDRARRIKHYDYLRLVKDYSAQPDVMSFDAKDYVEFA